MNKPSYEELESVLLKITAIAHFGGLNDMSSDDALRAIRKATLQVHFDKIASKQIGSIKEVVKQ